MLYNVIFFYFCAFFYAVATVLYAMYLWKKEEVFFAYSKQWLWVGLFAGIFSFLTRYRELSHLPLVTLYEITFFYALLVSAAYILFVTKNKPKFVQGLLLFIFDGIIFLDLFLDKRIHTLNPLLNSFWLGIHVPAAMLSYSAFALSFAVSLYYVIAQSKGKQVSHLDGFNSGLIVTGAILLGIGIVTGAIWARSAWGRYWSWDPKETWALVTFIIYGCAALMSTVFGLRPRWQAIVSLCGFAAMMFTFFGVSLLLGSHHAYR